MPAGVDCSTTPSSKRAPEKEKRLMGRNSVRDDRKGDELYEKKPVGVSLLGFAVRWPKPSEALYAAMSIDIFEQISNKKKEVKKTA